jgi:hypothetical protein
MSKESHLLTPPLRLGDVGLAFSESHQTFETKVLDKLKEVDFKYPSGMGENTSAIGLLCCDR